MIEIHRRVPGDGRMAGLAAIGTHDVADGLGRGPYTMYAEAVAGRAIGRSSLEHGVVVAALASQIAVLADELEARGQVIEARLRRISGQRAVGP